MFKALVTYTKYVDALNRLVGKFAMYLMFLMMFILLYASVSRSLLNSPVVWAVEMAQFTMAAYYLLGGGYSVILRGHVRMDVLYSTWTPKTRAIIDALTSVFLLFYLGMLLYGGISSTAYSLEYGQKNYSAWRLLHPDDRAAAMDMLNAHLRGETEFYDFEYRLRCKDGSYKWIHSRGKLMERGTTGEPLRITGTHHDMSERKAMEEQVLANEAFLETLLGSIEEGISVIAPDMTVRYANPTMVRWYALDVPAVGRKCHQAFHRLNECCARCPAVRSLRTGRNEFEILEVMSSRNPRSIEFSSYPIKDNHSGAVTGVIVFVRDITARRQPRSDRIEADLRYRSVCESAPIGICTVDAGGRYVAMNPSYARMHGYDSPQEMMDSVRSLSDIFAAPEDLAALRELIRTRDMIHGFECRIRRKDGATPWTSRTIRVVRDERGELECYDVFVEDIQARKALELIACGQE